MILKKQKNQNIRNSLQTLKMIVINVVIDHAIRKKKKKLIDNLMMSKLQVNVNQN